MSYNFGMVVGDQSQKSDRDQMGVGEESREGLEVRVVRYEVNDRSNNTKR